MTDTETKANVPARAPLAAGGPIQATEWRGIPGWPEYEASSVGKIRRVSPYLSTWRGRILTDKQRPDGYCVVKLSREGRAKLCYVHRLVASAFHGEPPSPSHAVAHNDGQRDNNSADNLRWATYAENEADKALHGTRLNGEQIPNAKLTRDDTHKMRLRYSAGARQVDLAADFGISQAQVSRIVRNESWIEQ